MASARSGTTGGATRPLAVARGRHVPTGSGVTWVPVTVGGGVTWASATVRGRRACACGSYTAEADSFLGVAAASCFEVSST
eukprot:3784200-Prymnesium_polylepis.1